MRAPYDYMSKCSLMWNLIKAADAKSRRIALLISSIDRTQLFPAIIQTLASASKYLENYHQNGNRENNWFSSYADSDFDSEDEERIGPCTFCNNIEGVWVH